MPRERWFYAKDNRRQGPFPRQQLVESLLGQPDPQSCLIWRHGLPAWTRAGEVPEVDRHLAPFAKQRAAATPAVSVPAAADAAEARAAGGRASDVRSGAYAPAVRGKAAGARPSMVPYAAGAGVVLVAVLGAWLFWPKSDGDPAKPGPGGAPTEAGAGAAPGSGAGGTAPGSGAGGKGSGQFAGWAEREGELPASELKKLRGVGSWADQKLTITLYNGSAWRVTEIVVRTSRLSGDQFIDAEQPVPFLPVGAKVDAPVADLLNKVAPGRRRPGVNPDDTVPFAAQVGPAPEAYRWRIEAAKGYAPRAGG